MMLVIISVLFLHGKKHTTLTTKDSHAYFQSLHHDLVTPKTHKATKSKGEKQSVSKTYGLILSVARVSNLMRANLGPAFTLRKKPDYFAVDMTWGFQARLARIFENFGKHHSASKAVRHTKGHLELFLSEYNNWNRETSDEKIAPSRLGAFRPHTKSTELKCKPSYTKKSASGKKAKKSASGKGGKRKAAPKKRKSASIKKEASIAQAIKVAEADAKRTVVAVEHIKHPTRVGARVRKTVDRYQG